MFLTFVMKPKFQKERYEQKLCKKKPRVMVSKRTISDRTHEYACAQHVEEMKEIALCIYMVYRKEINNMWNAQSDVFSYIKPLITIHSMSLHSY